MATITSLGVGSGLDLTGLLDQLQAAERGKLAPITLQKKQQQAKISAFGQLQTSLNAFQDAVAKINDPQALPKPFRQCAWHWWWRSY
ncbi:flagellar cap protein FliD N-terminal domain-containing protein [Halomonas sp. IOP_6]|uniref:flagellar cap protein FliD N-terminal domain-containing protein n=1 Tax=Halomonas sp. IOP_6 TaxID=2876583 RepID=UPI002F3FE5B1